MDASEISYSIPSPYSCDNRDEFSYISCNADELCSITNRANRCFVGTPSPNLDNIAREKDKGCLVILFLYVNYNEYMNYIDKAAITIDHYQ